MNILEKMKKNFYKGAIYIALGSASYGILATAVKYANLKGVTTASLTFSQALFGAMVLTLLSLFPANKEKETVKNSSKLKLMAFGTSLGFTSSFYYLSLSYVPVSVAIILLMQSIWMGVVLEFFINKKVNGKKLLGAVITLIGTSLAAKLFEDNISINLTGITFGLLAALSYTVTIYASNKVSLDLPTVSRSKYLVYGGLLAVIGFWNVAIFQNDDWMSLMKWGAFLGLFGTILPPLLYSKGFPKVGTGLGSIISAIEIPISVLSAHFVLKEQISNIQWIGILIILFSIIFIQLFSNKQQE